MKTRFVVRLACAGLVLALSLSAAVASPAAPGTLRPVKEINAFGLMISAEAVSLSDTIELARDMGVAYYRLSRSIVVETWEGQCAECDLARQAGLSLALTVQASGGPGVPGGPPANLNAYVTRLGEILDGIQPAMLIVENEENSELYYTGTPEEYGVQLRAACEVAHARGIPCSNGGLVSALVALLTWEDFLVSGDPDQACDFAWRAFGEPGEPIPPELLCRAQSVANLPQPMQDMIAKGHALLSRYPAAKVDAVNFHWYISDAQALGETVAYLRTQSDAPVMSNEMGQHNEDPGVPPALLTKARELGLAAIVWFSMDLAPARSLINPDASLRPNGQAYRDFIVRQGRL